MIPGNGKYWQERSVRIAQNKIVHTFDNVSTWCWSSCTYVMLYQRTFRGTFTLKSMDFTVKLFEPPLGD